MRSFQKGITLVEMLVALTVFSAIATSCVVLMRLGLESDEQLQGAADVVAEFQIARALMKSDFAQIANRQSRDELGRASIAPMKGGAYNRGTFVVNDSGETVLISMVSNGRFNPAAAYPQATLQYIEYLLTEGQVVRRVWPYLDRLEGAPVSEQILFAGLENVTIRFLDGPRWSDQWQSRAGTVAPRAVDLQFVHPQFGAMNQLFFIEGVAG